MNNQKEIENFAALRCERELPNDRNLILVFRSTSSNVGLEWITARRRRVGLS